MVHFVNLLQGQEGEPTDALHHVGVAHVAPVLVELVGAGLVGIEPDGVARRLAHLVALGIGKQIDGESVGVLPQLAADELGAPQHIAPLVIATKLHITAHCLEHMIEVIGLHDHIVEFQKGESLLHALLIALRPQHIVHREAGAHLPQKLYVVKVQEPVRVVEHHGLAGTLAKLDKAAHLPLKALGVVVNVLSGKHLAHIRPPGGVADHGGAAPNQGNGLVARQLEPLHQGQRHKMPRRQAVRSAVVANIEGGLAVVDESADLLLIRYLSDQPPGLQFLINGHVCLSFSRIS